MIDKNEIKNAQMVLRQMYRREPTTEEVEKYLTEHRSDRAKGVKPEDKLPRGITKVPDDMVKKA